MIKCEDCGGSGNDIGALYEREDCPTCAGSGIEPEVETVERKPMGNEQVAEPFRAILNGITLGRF